MLNRRDFIHQTTVALTLVGALPLSAFAARKKPVAAASAAQPETPLTPANVKTLPAGANDLDLFLLMGQSNMKGRGEVPPGQQDNPRIVMLHMRNDQWYFARDPLHMAGVADKIDGSSNAGVGPGMSFARAVVAREPDVMVGLIPCAVGGSKIALWQKGAPHSLYDEAVRRAKLALASGAPGQTRIRAALWLQGESDSKQETYEAYPAKLLKVVDTLRADLALPELPFIACTIGSFIATKAAYPRTKEINNDLRALPEHRPHTTCVDAHDLKGNIGDNLHYNTESQLAIGRRYAEKLFALEAKK